MHDALPIVLTSEKLPPLLADLPKPPPALFVRGELPRGPAVAVVGTRAPTPEGLQFTLEIAADLARAGVAILSGGARGVDTAAHRGALSAGGVTVVLAPAGFHAPYPPENAELFGEIVAKAGAYVSLVPDDQPATRAAFFGRNACLAALSHALILVQCGLRSGARNAVAQARRLGKPIFVVPSAPWISKGRGCLLELRQGARLCESSRDVLLWLKSAGYHALGLPAEIGVESPNLESPAESPLASPPEALLALVKEGVTHLDELSEKTGLSLSALQERLLELCLIGSLRPNLDGTYRIPD